MEKELGRFGVKYSFFPAVDGNNLTKEERRSYSLRHAMSTYHWPLENRQIGCALSHVYVWEKMVAQSIKELLIVQDDCVFEDHFFDVLICRESWLPSGWGLINFHTPVWDSDIERTPLHNLGNSIPPLELIALKRVHYRLTCCLVNLHAAQQLLDIAYPIRMTDDKLSSIASISRLDAYTIFPLLAKTSRYPSTIQRRAPRIWKRIVRQLSRLRYGVDYKSVIEEDHNPGTLKRVSRQRLIKERVKKLLK